MGSSQGPSEGNNIARSILEGLFWRHCSEPVGEDKSTFWRMYCASHKRSDGMRQGTGNRVDELNLGDLLDV